jgi:hypothetical protein
MSNKAAAILFLEYLNRDSEDLVEDDILAPDLMQKFCAAAALTRAIRGAGGLDYDEAWDEPVGKLTGADYPKHGAEFRKSTGTMAERLGVVRTEFVRIDGTRWVHAFDDRGELVDTRIVFEE